MKKYFRALAAFAITSLSAAFAAPTGDIYSIDALSSMTEYQAGDTVEFRIRLVAGDYAVPEAQGVPTAWTPKYIDFGSELLDEAINPPRIGIIVSGHLTYADVVRFEYPKIPAAGDLQANPYTDLICRYQVGPGEIALPVKLAAAGSTTEKPTIASEGTEILFDGLGKWQLWGKKADRTDTQASFRFCADETANDVKQDYAAIGNQTKDIDLAIANFRVRSVDFDSSYDDQANGVWRCVKQGSEETLIYQPTIKTIGQLTDKDRSTTLYVWSEDDSVVRLAGDAVEQQITKGAVTMTRYVKEIRLEPGTATYPISLRGADSAAKIGNETKLILSPTLGYPVNAAGDVIVGSVLEAKVKCDNPPTASVQVCFDPNTATTAKEWHAKTPTYPTREDAIPLYVWLSKTPDHDIPVTLSATNGSDGSNPLESGALGISEQNNVFDATDLAYTKFRILKGQQWAKVYLWGLGGDVETAKGIALKVAFVDPADEAEYPGTSTPATLYLERAEKPTIVSPVQGADIGQVSLMDGFTLPLEISSSYRDLNAKAGFKVVIKSGTSTLYSKDDILFRDGVPTDIEINEGYTYDSKNPQKTAKITVTTPDGRVATSEFTFWVAAPKTVSAELVLAGEVGTRFDENEVAAKAPVLHIRLSEAADGKRWAYLKPLNTESKDLVSCTAGFTKGILIDAGETESDATVDPAFLMKDGTAKTDGSSGTLEYEVVLRTEDTPPPEDDDGNTDDSFVSKLCTVRVANVPASVAGVYLDTTLIPNTGDAETPFAIAVPSGIETAYNIRIDEPSSVDRDAQLVTIVRWTTDRNMTTWTKNPVVIESADPLVTAKITLSTPESNHRVTVVTLDKDTIEAAGIVEGDYTTGAFLLKLPEGTPKYEFVMTVAHEPHVMVETKGFYTGVHGSTMDETGNAKAARLLVSIDEPAEEDLNVRVWARPIADDKPGHVEFYAGVKSKVDADGNAYVDLTIKSGSTEPEKSSYYTPGEGLKFNYAKLDGTPNSLGDGWAIEAEITTVAEKGKDYFQPFDNLTIYVENNAPTIKRPSMTANVTTNTSQQVGIAFPIKWQVTDVSAIDLAHVWPNGQKGLRVEWYRNGEHLEGVNGDPEDQYSTGDTEGVVNMILREEGLTEIEMRVYDKDGDEDEAYVTSHVMYYYIRPQKKLVITPFYPAENTKSKYGRYPGLGQGRVFADGGNPVIDGFVQSWSYTVTRGTGYAFAFGYPASEEGTIDNGTLAPGYDVAIDANGTNHKTGGTYYTYTEPFDNFFYCWAYVIPADNGGAPEVQLGPVQATVSPSAIVREAVTLDAYEDNKVSYLDRTIEAIFSREYLTSDNLGDINADGIPDVYLRRYEGLGVLDGLGTVVGNDKAPIAGQNPDGDMLPGELSSAMGSFIPGLSNNWTRAFNNKTEIRGVYEALNDAAASTKYRVTIKNVMSDIRYTDPETDEKSTLSDLEYVAWTNFCGRVALEAGAPGSEAYDLAYADVTNRVDGTKIDPTTNLPWSPENPTDPTMADTDEDGLPDGYEYYYWYRAYIGTCQRDNSGKIRPETYARITGRKYVPLKPRDPEIIPTERILEICNPNVPMQGFKVDQDTDNDGITDLDELDAGTNPFDFDTDGDGLPDGYELAVSHTNPCVADRNSNVDGDQMAQITIGEMWPVYVLGEEGGQAVTNTIWSMGRPTIDADPADASKTNLTSTTSLFTGWVYDRNNAGNPTWALGRQLLSKDDEDYAIKVDDYKVVGMGTAAVEMRAMHFQVYALKGFDPRTAWNTVDTSTCKLPYVVDTVPFTAYDEYMTLGFFLNVGALTEGDVAGGGNALVNMWQTTTTDPTKADTDDDGIPDGWELYVMGAGEFTCGNPSASAANHDNHSPMVGWSGDADQDGLSYQAEFSGIESAMRYENCETITLVHPEWKNKMWPTDPFNNDTDNDGIFDGAEHKFIYGNYPAVTRYEDGPVRGGGMNPNSWDTDLDGLPDPWEDEFGGEIVSSSTTVETIHTETREDGTTVTTTNGVADVVGPHIENGMDPTLFDCLDDADNDGLANWQEYMVGAMRCWRYDDLSSPWTVHKISSAELATRMTNSPENDKWWYDTLVNFEGEHGDARDFNTLYNPGLKNEIFNTRVYFSANINPYDLASGATYILKDGVYHDLVGEPGKPNRWTERAIQYGSAGLFALAYDNKMPICPQTYICCDPRLADTDGDGMDDYYELYHGLNPLLGAAGLTGEDGGPRDIVYVAYRGSSDAEVWSAMNNFWVGDPAMSRGTLDEDPRFKDEEKSITDFYQWPWLAGLATADPDGDNIRNQQEAIMPKVQAASTFLHTDPTPLWMTDSSYTNSLTYRFYHADTPAWAEQVTTFAHESGEFTYDGKTYRFADISGFSWDDSTHLVSVSAGMDAWSAADTQFSFEENEGYDTDHDALSDYAELEAKTNEPSDPQNFDDPVRHQAMYFNGVDAFLQTPLETPFVTPEEEANGEFRQNYLYYTVEFWVKPNIEVVNPNGGLYTVIERAVNNGVSGPADEKFLRKAFLVGVKNGRWYTKFDTNGTDLGQPVEIVDGPQATTDWTHIAVTYGPENGNEIDPTQPMALKLYVNGECTNTKRSNLLPANLVAALTVDQIGSTEEGGELRWSQINGKWEVSTIVGASAATRAAIAFNAAWERRFWMLANEENPLGLYEQTTFDDYSNFFAGYVDEIRLWDGARTAEDIAADVANKTRYTQELVAANRQAVFEAWQLGAIRSPQSTGAKPLPAELLCHWSFDQLPGAVLAEDVIKVPAGFSAVGGVTDMKATWVRPENWTCPWWDQTAVRSTVYTDAAWVPWIGNTVAHLPLFDGTTHDSFYWSEDYVGDLAATNSGYARFAFPRTAEPASRSRQQIFAQGRGTPGSPNTIMTRWSLVMGDEELAETYRFAHRNLLLEGGDLLPMGGAYPRRISLAEGGLWDSKAASDAWTQTGKDADNNGLPEWWEEIALAEYATGTAVDWNTTVNYHGVEMPAWQAYLRDLAIGLLPDGVIHPEYADTRDSDNDGVIDLFAKLYHLEGERAGADEDGDGLSNYAEYLITEVFKYAQCNPDKYATNGRVCDYFLKVGDLYLGEIFTDHDRMNDVWEDSQKGIHRGIYDAHLDADDNGWSNYAEYRAEFDELNFVPTLVTNEVTFADGSVSNMLETAYVYAGTPTPTITARLTYNGSQKVGDAVVVQAWKDPTMSTRPDATWTLAASNLVSKVGNIRTYVMKTPTEGQVKEGLTTFACMFVGAEGATGETTTSAAYTPGAPWGFIRDVNVGWNAAEFDLELTDVSPVFARFDLTDGSSDRLRLWGRDSGDMDLLQHLVGTMASNYNYDTSIATETLGGGTRNHVRIVPYTISGTIQDNATYTAGKAWVRTLQILTNAQAPVVAEFDVDVNTHPFITEADFITSDKFDIFWDGLADSFMTNPQVQNAVGELTAIKYGIVVGSDPLPEHTADTTTVARVFSTLIERRYEARNKRTLPSAMALKEGGILYGGRPTFTWRLDEPTTVVNGTPSAALNGCSYTAFQIQVADSAGTIVWDSGLNRAPRTDSTGAFVWQAPLVAGQQTSLAKIFSRAGNWQWRVAMYNAKFKPATRESANGWSAWTPFSTAVGQLQKVGDHGFGSIAATVKYAGPAKVLEKAADLTTVEGKVRVQAFATPDCSGAPLAEMTLTSVESLTNVADTQPNAELAGLELGGTYYVRAYIDTNGNGRKDIWESWGDATDAAAVSAYAQQPAVTVWIEDCDTDGDWIPDAYEMAAHGNLTTKNAMVNPDGEIILKTTTLDGVVGGMANFSQILSGASLALFENFDAAKLLLGLGDDTTTDTLAAIRAAVDRQIKPYTTKVTNMSIDTAAKTVTLTVSAEMTDPTGLATLSPIYALPTLTTVYIDIYKKASVVDANWVYENTYETKVSTLVDATVKVDIDDDLSAGFFKVEVRR